MKKLLLGSLSLFLFAISIAVVQISCQKTIAQTTITQTSAHVLLFHTYTLDSVTYVVQKDDTSAHNYQITIGNPINTYYWSDINGNNQKIIPIAIPSGMYSGDYAKLTDDATILVFSLYKSIAPNIGEMYPQNVYYIYSCNIDGSNLKQVKEASTLDDVH